MGSERDKASSLTWTQLTEVEQDRNESCGAEDTDPCSSHRERSEQRRFTVQEQRTGSSGTRRVFFIAKKERTVKAQEATQTQKKRARSHQTT